MIGPKCFPRLALVFEKIKIYMWGKTMLCMLQEYSNLLTNCLQSNKIVKSAYFFTFLEGLNLEDRNDRE